MSLVASSTKALAGGVGVKANTMDRSLPPHSLQVSRRRQGTAVIGSFAKVFVRVFVLGLPGRQALGIEHIDPDHIGLIGRLVAGIA